MQKLDDATAHMTFLAMVADLQNAWQVHLDTPDDYFDVVRKLIEDWWEMTGSWYEELGWLVRLAWVAGKRSWGGYTRSRRPGSTSFTSTWDFLVVHTRRFRDRQSPASVESSPACIQASHPLLRMPRRMC